MADNYGIFFEIGDFMKHKTLSLLLTWCLLITSTPCASAAAHAASSEEIVSAMVTEDMIPLEVQSISTRTTFLSNNFYYFVEDGNATITGCTQTSGELVIPSKLDGYSVTSIADAAFNWCTSLTKVTIPASIISLQPRVFFNCTNLSTVVFSSGSQLTEIGFSCFAGTSISSITIPNTVTVIGDYAFEGTKLTKITLPPNLTSLGVGVFSDTPLEQLVLPSKSQSDLDLGGSLFGVSSLEKIDLNGNTKYSLKTDGLYSADGKTLFLYLTDERTEITVSSGVEGIGTNAFGLYYLTVQKITLPESVKKLSVSVCEGLYKLNSINIPSSVTEIPDRAFSGTNLKTVVLPTGVSRIGALAFGVLTSINFPDTLKEIGDQAFAGLKMKTLDLSALTKLTRIGDGAFQQGLFTNVILPDSLTYLGNAAFDKCQKLTSIVLGSGLEYMGWYAFRNCYKLQTVALPTGVTYGLYDGDPINSYGYIVGHGAQFENCRSLNTVSLPSGMTEIPAAMFFDCTSLTTVNCPSTVKTIGAGAFEGCESLDSFQFPNGLTRIEDYAFSHCYKLTEARFPETLEFLGIASFRLCIELESIYIPAKVTVIEDGVFISCYSMKEYEVSGKNPAYCAVDGVLFSKDMMKLVAYPAKKETTVYRIPDTVQELVPYAFEYAENLKEIHFSETPLTMNNCFSFSSSLTEVYIPGCVSMDDHCFTNCENLSTVILGEGISVIGTGCFAVNPVLSSIVIPGSVTRIERLAFEECESLTEIRFIEGQPLTIESDAFAGNACSELVLPGTLIDLRETYDSYFYEDMDELILLPSRRGVETMIATLPELPYTYLPGSITQFSRYSIDVPFDGTLIHTPAGSRAEKEITDYAGWDAQYYTNSLPAGIEPWRLALGLTIQDGVCSARAVNLDNKYNQGNLLVLAAYRNGKMIAEDIIVPKSHTDLSSFKLSNLDGVTLKVILLDKDLRPVVDAVVYDIYL